MSDKPKFAFAVVPERAVKDRRLMNAAFRVLAAIASYADQDGRCYPSLRRIGEDLGCSKQAIHQQVKVLIAAGYVAQKRTRRPNGSDSSNHYQILCPAAETDSEKRQPHIDARQRHVDPPSTSEVDPPSTSEVDPSNTPPTTPSNNVLPMPPPKGTSASPADLFQRFWQHYPKKIAKEDAEKAFKAALKVASFKDIFAGTRRYADHVRRNDTPKKFIKYPSGGMRAKRWLDEDAADGPEDPDVCFKGGETADNW